jgi:hypothetical protein
MSIATPMKEPTEQTGGASARACCAVSQAGRFSSASAARSLPKCRAKDENGRQGRAYQRALRRRSCGSDAPSPCARKRGRACLSRPIFCDFAPTARVGRGADVVSAAAHRRSDDFVSFGFRPVAPSVSKARNQPKRDTYSVSPRCLAEVYRSDTLRAYGITEKEVKIPRGDRRNWTPKQRLRISFNNA